MVQSKCGKWKSKRQGLNQNLSTYFSETFNSCYIKINNIYLYTYVATYLQSLH